MKHAEIEHSTWTWDNWDSIGPLQTLGFDTMLVVISRKSLSRYKHISFNIYTLSPSVQGGGKMKHIGIKHTLHLEINGMVGIRFEDLF